MKKTVTLALSAVIALAMLSGCGKIIEREIKKNPNLVFNAIKEDPKGFMDAVNSTRDKMQEIAEKEAQENEAKEMEDAFKNPQMPEIAEGRPVLGAKDAPITIVEYADFACYYCAQASATMQKVKEEYGDKVKVLYKHFPVLGVPASMTASKIMEAMTKVDVEKAYKFNKIVFENQGKLKDPKAEDFLKAEGRKLFGAKFDTILKNANSSEIESIIKADATEASNKFGLRGTPAFNINGVFLKGAYPYEKFKEVIDRHLAKK